LMKKAEAWSGPAMLASYHHQLLPPLSLWNNLSA
jgi:hypothetical protein